jgi:hypothetical protein
MEKRDINVIMMENTLTENEKETTMSREEKDSVAAAKKSGTMLLVIP